MQSHKLSTSFQHEMINSVWFIPVSLWSTFTVCELENGGFIVDLPSYNMVIFRYVNVYQRVNLH
jgi:hypothetical protein